MKNTVISTIVENDLCVGCGVCAAICPEKSLEMQFNKFGEYNPVQSFECVKKCGLCLKVCPFANGNDNEDFIGKALYSNIPEIQHSLETGYYFSNYVGFASETRSRGASGGMATWLLASLLKKSIVDYVIAVVPNNDPEKLFKFTIFSDSESVTSASGSAYYPVELSEVLNRVQTQPGKYAIIGLPCFVKAIRLAQKSNKKLRERIIVILGLTCGQLKNKQFTEYTSHLAGVDERLFAVRYREKNEDQPASNFYFSFTSLKKDVKRLSWNDGIYVPWDNRWFTLNACNYCDDVFTECADVTFMDAWLPEYDSDYRGTNLVLVRSEIIQKLIDDGVQSEQIKISSLPVREIIRSQKGVIQKKIHQIRYRLHLSHEKGLKVPIKRLRSPSSVLNPYFRRQTELIEKMRMDSRVLWIDCKNTQQFDKFQQIMSFHVTKVRKWERISRPFLDLLIIPVNAAVFTIKKIRSFLHG